MAYTLFTASYGLSSANFRVRILEVGTGIPAIITLHDGTVVNSQGETIIDAYGNLAIYLDDTKTFGVHINQYLLQEADSNVAAVVRRTALQLASTPTQIDIGLGPGALFYSVDAPTIYYRISSDGLSFVAINASTGDPGVDGLNNASVFLYQRSTSPPSTPSLPITYTFATAFVSGLTGGWVASVPAGTDPLWVTSAAATARTTTVSLSPGEWATPVIFSQNGINSATVTLFQRTTTSTPPSVPDVTVTYTFSTGIATGLDNGWTQSLPTTGGMYRWTTNATALATGGINTDTINPAEWSPVSVIAQDGADGASGINNAVVYAFQRASSAPTLPTATVTYTFLTGVSTGLNNGWTSTLPAGTLPIYVTIASAAGSGSTDSISPGEWASPIILSQNGSDGANGLNTAAVFLYKVTATSSAPALPSATVTYTFSTATTTGVDNGWTQTLPTTGGSYRWLTTASALSATDTDTIAPTEWAPVSLLAADGTAGAPGADGTNGTNGSNGLNNAVVLLYQRGVSSPSLPSATVTYTFATGVATGLTNGWIQTIPTGTDPIYVTSATASAGGATDTIASGEWSSTVILSQNGVAGLNAATVYLFQRTSTSTPPSVPSATITYTFATGIATGITNGWTQTLPSTGGAYRWVTTATALGNGATDTIATGEWATVSILAQDGANGTNGTNGSNGSNGADGINNAVVLLYQRAASTPSLPSATITYTFSTTVATGLTNGWTQTIPTGTNPIYVTSATASATGTFDTIASAEWASAVILSQNGLAGLNTATVYLFQVTATSTPPSVPSATVTYTFSTATTTGVTNGWTQTLPTTGGSYRWVTTATALSTGTTDTIANTEWAAVSLLAQDGVTGPTGTSGTNGLNNAVVLVYQRATSAPAVPSATVTYTFASALVSGLTNGWTTTIPTGTNPIYATSATASSSGTTDTIASAEWATPIILAQNGANGATGSNGTNGADGLNAATVYLFQRTATSTPPAVPSATITYTFATGVASGLTNSWTQTLPTTGGTFRWVTTATALSTGTTDTIANTEWAAVSILAQDGTNGTNGSAGTNGTNGTNGLNNAVVLVYQRSLTTPSLPSAAVTYTFSTAGISGLTNGWTATIPTGTNPIYATSATASSTGTTDTIAPAEWATAVIIAQNGTSGTNGTNGSNGSNGADGLNAATVYLFQRTSTSSAPTLPSATVTYTFATGVASGLTNSWTQTLPTTGGTYRWITTATALSVTGTDTIASTEWAAASLLAQDGANGSNGATGATGATGAPGSAGSPGTQTANPTVYQWAAAAPAAPTGTPIYTWSTASFGAAPSGWTLAPGTSPTSGYTLWAATVTVIDVATNTATGFNWTGATVSARGVAGTNGTNGLNSAVVLIYQRATSTPAVPSATITYTFSTAGITGLTNGWLAAIPAGSNPIYTTSATASSVGTTDTITTGEWSSPVILSQDGTNGLNAATVYLFQRTSTSTAPTLPSATITYTFSTSIATGLTNSWTQTLPTTGGSYRWMTIATALSNTSTDTIATTEWAAASLLSQDGTNGSNGATGATGAAGARGSQTFYVALSGSTNTYSDSLSTSTASVGGGPILNDLVTQYNSSVGFSQSKFWNGSGWVLVTNVLDGNLLVTGTVGVAALVANSITAAKIASGTITGTQIAANTITAGLINSNGLSIKDTSGNIILSAGAPLAAQIEPGSGNLYRNGDFTVSTGGIPTYFDVYNNTPISYTTSVNSGGPIGSSNYWRFTATSTATANFGFSIRSTGIAGWTGFQQNTDYVWSFYARTSVGSTLLSSTMNTGWNHAPATLTWLSNPILTTSWQRYAFTLNFGSRTLDPNGFITVTNLIHSGDVLDFACNQIETGTAASGWAPILYIDSSGVVQSANGGTGVAVDNSLLNSSISDKLSKSAPSILASTVSINATAGAGFVAGNLTWNSSGVRTGGSGVALTPGGLIGTNGSGTTTFSIDASTGNAFFGGTLAVGTASRGSVNSNLQTNITITGAATSISTGLVAGATATIGTGDILLICNLNMYINTNTSTFFQLNLDILDGTSTSLFGGTNPAPAIIGSVAGTKIGGALYNWTISNNFDLSILIPGGTLSLGAHTFYYKATALFYNSAGSAASITGSYLNASGQMLVREFLA